MKTKKQKIEYFERLIVTAKELHKEYPLDEYDKLCIHYKEIIKGLKK